MQTSFQDGCKKIVDKLTALGYTPDSPQGPNEINVKIQAIYNDRYNRGFTDGLNRALSNGTIKYTYHSHTAACKKTCTYYTDRVITDVNWEANTCVIHDREYGHTCGKADSSKTFNWTVAGGGGWNHVAQTHETYVCGKTTSSIVKAEIVFN